MMNKQEIFDTVVKHLFNQGVRAVSWGEGGADFCSYRGENGTMCAVGCLIPESLYIPAMEGETVHGDWMKDALTKMGILHDTQSWESPEYYENIGMLSFLRALQKAHDNPDWSGDHLKQRLESVAMTYKLDTEVLNESI